MGSLNGCGIAPETVVEWRVMWRESPWCVVESALWDPGGIGQVDQEGNDAAVILVKEAESIVAHKHAGVWWRSISHGMLQDVCDQYEQDVKQSVKEYEFWLVCVEEMAEWMEWER